MLHAECLSPSNQYNLAKKGGLLKEFAIRWDLPIIKGGPGTLDETMFLESFPIFRIFGILGQNNQLIHPSLFLS